MTQAETISAGRQLIVSFIKRDTVYPEGYPNLRELPITPTRILLALTEDQGAMGVVDNMGMSPVSLKQLLIKHVGGQLNEEGPEQTITGSALDAIAAAEKFAGKCKAEINGTHLLDGLITSDNTVIRFLAACKQRRQPEDILMSDINTLKRELAANIQRRYQFYS